MMGRRSWPCVLVMLLLLGCAAGPRPGAPIPERSAAAAPTVGAPASRPADAATYLHVALAHLYAQGGQLAEAIGELRKAIDRDPKTPELWLQLAKWLARQEAYDDAVEAAKRGLALDPTAPAAHLTLADLYHAQKKPAEATAALEEAIRLNPSAPAPYETLARHFADRRD